MGWQFYDINAVLRAHALLLYRAIVMELLSSRMASIVGHPGWRGFFQPPAFTGQSRLRALRLGAPCRSRAHGYQSQQQRLNLVPIHRSGGSQASEAEIFRSPERDLAMVAHDILLRRGNNAMQPSRLLERMTREWTGDLSRAPSGITFIKHYPALFELGWKSKEPASAYLSEQGVLVSNSDNFVPVAYPLLPLKSRANIADLSETSLHWVRLTPAAKVYRTIRPNGTTWNNDELARAWSGVITKLLEGSEGRRMDAEALRQALQSTIVRENLPLPPSGLTWFIMSRRKDFERFRPLWVSERRGRALQLLMTGVELMDGPAVETDFAELAALAATLPDLPVHAAAPPASVTPPPAGTPLPRTPSAQKKKDRKVLKEWLSSTSGGERADAVRVKWMRDEQDARDSTALLQRRGRPSSADEEDQGAPTI